MEQGPFFDPWGNDAEERRYVPAPVPAHERTWRHPSEIGQAEWVRTEPPIAIGRGLLFTTGAIGCAVGIAVLWLLVPIGGGLAPSASPEATFSMAIPTMPRPADPTTTQRSEVVGGELGSMQIASTVVLPSEELPVNTALVSRPAAPEISAIAVAIFSGESVLIVTTARAVVSDEILDITTATEPVSGAVVSVQGDLAFLESAGQLEMVAFTAVGQAEPGQPVMVLGIEQTEVAFVATGQVVELDAAEVLEGTPVIDHDGALVALCTLTVAGTQTIVEFVPIDLPDDELPAGTPDPPVVEPATSEPSTIATTPAPAPGWLGIRFGDAPGSAPPIVTSVVVDGPAAMAGVQAGDRILAVGPTSITRIDQLLAIIQTSAPGTRLELTISSSATAAAPASTVTASTPTSPISTISTRPVSSTTPTIADPPVSATTSTSLAPVSTTSPTAATPAGTGVVPAGARIVSVVLGLYEAVV